MKTVAAWLEQHRAETVAQLVDRTCAELPDYRKRPAAQLAAAAGAAYDQWCDTVLSNDLMRHAPEASAVIAQNVERGVDPAQMARIPALICAVVLGRLAQAGPEVDPAELVLFRSRALRITERILSIGGLRIAREVLHKAVGEPFMLPPEGEKSPGS